ncbi:hypothetical protein [Kovacikia minuta]|nr:hypothetical protein [Kovacikia minuta]
MDNQRYRQEFEMCEVLIDGIDALRWHERILRERGRSRLHNASID